jgi:hypothetical protein
MEHFGGVLETKQIELEINRCWTPLEVTPSIPHPLFLGRHELRYMKKTAQVCQILVWRCYFVVIFRLGNFFLKLDSISPDSRLLHKKHLLPELAFVQDLLVV